ncbi:ALI_collapsed_G0006430.mRNA.1.CDS.1 [Saccharomyces cerevisiae]|nr:ALI_collapsed_G0006430.mRNA.1.CDS.1 [Saccharomyces cerevisiae]
MMPIITGNSLASQVSLSEGLKVNTEEDAAIINKSQDDAKAERMTQISEVIEYEMQQPIPTYLPKAHLDGSGIEKSDDKFFEIEEELKEELKGSKTGDEDVDNNNPSNSIPKIEKPQHSKLLEHHL